MFGEEGARIPTAPPATSTKPWTEIDEQKKLGFGPEEVDLRTVTLDSAPGYRPSIGPGTALAWSARSSEAVSKFDLRSGRGRGFFDWGETQS